MNRTQYVVGLCLDHYRQFVVMVHKRTGPPCVIGNWNGVGGKIDPGETPSQAMSREFQEETGVMIAEGDWHQFATLTASDYDLHFFWSVSTSAFFCRTMEDEPIKTWYIPNLLAEQNVMPSMRWMIPYLQDYNMCPHMLGTLFTNR